MSKKWVVIDFETASGTDLKKSGAYKYAECPTTEILTLGLRTHTGYGEVLMPDNLQPGGLLLELVNDPEVIFVAQNAPFERAIWRNLMERIGWPPIPIERWHCTMAVSLMKGLPAKLDIVARVLHLPVQKDMEGSASTIGMSKFDKKGMLDRSAEKYATAKSYVLDDCDVEVALLRRTHNFYGGERQVWELDQRINDRGIRLDTAYIHACMGVVERAMPSLLSRFKDLTGLKPSQNEKFKSWLLFNGLNVPDLRKETVAKLMGDEDYLDTKSLSEQDYEYDEVIDMPPICRQALYLRGLAASASIKKLPAMLACQGADDRARGLVQYHGAGPGRWAGRILQPHNFPRASVDIGDGADGKPANYQPDELVAAIMQGDDAFLQMAFGEPMEAVASGLRHALVSDPDKVLLIGDFAQIEARVVLAFAGQYDALETFVKGDPYSTMAEAIYKYKVTKKTHPEERTTGKQTILGCGFQMGAKTFHNRYCSNETIEFAQRCIDAYRKDMAPLVPKLWYGLEEASAKAVWDQRPIEFAGVVYQPEGEWLTCRLPSGRKLWYYGPQREKKPMPWDHNDIRPGWSHQTFKNGQWIRRAAYGGLLTENVVQAAARDLLVHCMFLCEKENLLTVLTVHDENVVEDSPGNAKLFEQIMTDTPAWAKAHKIPVSVEMMVAQRYRK